MDRWVVFFLDGAIGPLYRYFCKVCISQEPKVAFVEKLTCKHIHHPYWFCLLESLTPMLTISTAELFVQDNKYIFHFHYRTNISGVLKQKQVHSDFACMILTLSLQFTRKHHLSDDRHNKEGWKRAVKPPIPYPWFNNSKAAAIWDLTVFAWANCIYVSGVVIFWSVICESGMMIHKIWASEYASVDRQIQRANEQRRMEVSEEIGQCSPPIQSAFI